MTHAAIYARYSTDKQRSASIDDQLRIGRARAQHDGWPVAAVYSDDAVSGSAPVADRCGGRAMLADAAARRFTVLILESLDRLSRDLVEQERIVRRLEHRGIRIIGVADGYDTEAQSRKLVRVVRGLQNEMYIDDLRHKTHRALTGLALRGLSAGGLPYGYRSTEVDGGHRLEPVEEQARWVRWIFGQYTGGRSPRAIAHELNRLGVAAPRGGTWALSALYGHARYQTGILRNPIYIGRYIWNRSQWIKDPESGRRERHERPESEWLTAELPDLAVVPMPLWQAAQGRLRGPNRVRRGPPPRTPFSGLLRCGHCGGAVVAVDSRVYGCAAAKDRGASVCPGVRIKRDIMERRLMEILRDELLTEESIALLRREVAALQVERQRQAETVGRSGRDRLAVVSREIDRLVDAVAAAGWSDALRDRLKSAEAERSRLQAEIEAVQDVLPPQIVPGLVERYRRAVDGLAEKLKRDPQAARAALRETVGEVVLTQKAGHVYAEVPDFGLLIKLEAGAGVCIRSQAFLVA